jgi:hypothetical protein
VNLPGLQPEVQKGKKKSEESKRISLRQRVEQQSWSGKFPEKKQRQGFHSSGNISESRTESIGPMWSLNCGESLPKNRLQVTF